MTMKVLEDEYGLDRKRFQIAEGLRRILAVVQRDCPCGVSIVDRAGKAMLVNYRVSSAADQPAGDAPFEHREIQRRPCGAHQAHSAHLLDRFHHNDGTRGTDDDLWTLQ